MLVRIGTGMNLFKMAGAGIREKLEPRRPIGLVADDQRWQCARQHLHDARRKSQTQQRVPAARFFDPKLHDVLSIRVTTIAKIHLRVNAARRAAWSAGGAPAAALDLFAPLVYNL
ncbi:MAG TPA: hypothetical protein VLQ89_05285 [Candidatus Binatia bacterium]|nr:hypothetical protein [Candidatus Binatia bacterium]